MTSLAKIKASRATRANTNGRMYISVLPNLGNDVYAYSTVVVPTRFALVYGIMGSMACGFILIVTTLTLGWI
jgi:hypothetical protein